MGICRLPEKRFHWRNDEEFKPTAAADIMTRTKFEMIAKFIHFADNKYDENQDKLYKIRPLMRHM